MSTEREAHYDAAGSAGLSFGLSREPRARRSRLTADRIGRSSDELDVRDIGPMEVSESDRRTALPRCQDWRENRRNHQSSQILLAFGSGSPRWENAADLGRRCTSSSQLDAAGQRTPVDGKDRPAPTTASGASPLPLPLPLPLPPAATSASNLSAREEPSARRHRSDLTPTAPPGHSFRDPPPARHRSPGVSGSRPSSALSQQGGARASPLRPRSGARRPRPSSIAGMPSPRPTADSGRLHSEARVPSRSGSSSTPRRPLPASAPSSEARRPPPAAAAASPRRTPAQVKADDARKKKQRSKSGTPQPETRPVASQQPTSECSAGSEPSVSPAPSGSSAEGSTEQPLGGSTEPPPERTAPSEQTDGTTPGRKAGYDSETAARAAMTERRRRARDAAERQAEEERRRQEDEERQEQQRQEQEELMMQEAGRAEQERLQKAIQETEERRAEEERQKQREEEQRRQREQEEEAARQEAERARQAAAEKLQAEEVERKARRSRVAAIMSRTRASTNNNATDKTDSSEEEQSSLTAPPTSDDQVREESSSMESQASDSQTREEEAPDSEPAVGPVPEEVEVDTALLTSELERGTPPPEQSPDVNQEPEQEPGQHLHQEPYQEPEPEPEQDLEPEQEPELPMSTDSSPAHSSKVTAITNGSKGPTGTNGTNGLDNSTALEPASDSDNAHQNRSLPPLHTLVLKPAAASDDEDSLNSNVSPRPDLTSPQDPLSLGLTGGALSTQELTLTVHTPELVQL